MNKKYKDPTNPKWFKKWLSMRHVRTLKRMHFSIALKIKNPDQRPEAFEKLHKEVYPNAK